MAHVIAVVQVPALAQELLYATGADKKKKKKRKEKKSLQHISHVIFLNTLFWRMVIGVKRKVLRFI